MGEGRGEGKTTAPLSADLNPITDNRLKTYNGTTYYYDHFGNLIHRELANGEVQNYFYDLYDQLVKAEIFKKDGTKETWTYSYDALGRRIGKGRLKNEEVSETSFPHDLGGNGLENQTRFVWDGSHLLQEVQPDGRYTYIYTDPDSYEPLAQVHNWTTENGESRQQTHYFHCDQIGIPREMTDKDGNLLWFGNYTGWGRLKFVWDSSHLLQEVKPDSRYTYIYTDPDSYEPLALVHNRTNEDGESGQQTHYFHCDQIGIPREMTDKDGNLLWFGNYTGWGRLKEETKVTDSAYQPFRLQNQYCDCETGLHYNFFRYYEPDAGRFVNQDPIGLEGGDNLYTLMPNAMEWIDPLGLAPKAGDIKALQTGGNGTVVSVKSKADADTLLKAAFPDAQKVRGIGPEDASDARRLNKRIAFKKADGKVHYHKDYAMDKATERCKGHDDPQGTGHGKYPHINIRRPDGKQVRIDIIGK